MDVSGLLEVESLQISLAQHLYEVIDATINNSKCQQFNKIKSIQDFVHSDASIVLDTALS